MSKKIRRKLGRRIAQLRERQGLTQQDLADEAEMHQTYLCGVENGRRNSTIDVIARIATALGKDMSELFEY